MAKGARVTSAPPTRAIRSCAVRLARRSVSRVATLLRLSIDLFAPDAIPYATYFPAILIAALISGLGGGVFALALSALTAWYVFVPPRMSFAGWDVEHSVSLGSRPEAR